MTDTELLETLDKMNAIHEAGHAMLAYELGAMIYCVELGEKLKSVDDLPQGHVRYMKARFTRITISLGGAAAEMIYHRKHNNPTSSTVPIEAMLSTMFFMICPLLIGLGLSVYESAVSKILPEPCYAVWMQVDVLSNFDSRAIEMIKNVTEVFLRLG